MQKLIAAVVLALIPCAAWVAGCRQNEQAKSFPKGPEVKSLARKPVSIGAAPNRAATPATIDPEVLTTPDQPTFARIRAVMDREAQLASRYSQPGLFVLPREDFHDMAVDANALSAPESDLAVVTPPALTTREFWSRPPSTAPGALDTFPAFAGGDISAMVPPAAPLAPLSPALAPLAMPMLPGLAEPALPLESIPGLFMVGEQPVPSASRERPLSLAVPERAAGAGQTAAVAAADARGGTPGAMRSSPPFGMQPPDTAFSAPLFPSMHDNGKLAELLQKDSIRQALAPLPDISALVGSGEGKISLAQSAYPAAAANVAASASAPEWIPSRKDNAAATTVATAVPSRDVYMTDFWEKPRNRFPAETASNALNSTAETAAVSMPSAMAAKPDMASLAAPANMPSLPQTQAPTRPPEKISLQPRDQATPRARSELNRIDNSVDVPPLRY